jgi:hypothetical protein
MSDDGTGSERVDRVTDALMDGSAYERLRFERYSVFKQSIPRKLHLQSVLLFGLAAVLPVMAALPAEVRAALPSESVAAASPKIILLGLVGGATVFVCGLGLAMLAAARLQLEGRMTESQAETILSLEEVASLIGLIIGGVSILLTLCYVLLGYVGADAIEAYVRTVGRDPFVASGVGIPVVTVAASAFVGGVALFVLAQAIDLQFRLQLGA